MRRSWISIITVYTPMLGVPVLFFLFLIFTILHIRLAADVVLYLAMLGLIVFGIMSVRDVFFERFKPSKGISPGEVGGRSASKTSDKEVILTIKRFRPETGNFTLDEFAVKVDRYSSVLDALLSVKHSQDPGLALRYSCRMGICGSCGMVINGKPSLACETNALEAAKQGKIEVGPMMGHPLLRDLVTDFTDFFTRHQSISPHLYRNDVEEKYKAEKEYMQSKEELAKFLPFSYCIMCGLCVDACPVVNTNPGFIGPQALSQSLRYFRDSRDQMGERRLEMVDKLSYVWDCEFAGACSVVCPKGVDPAFAIQLLKAEIVKHDL
ncbi:MAG: succinate dehydrogenase iron-sulfur subunit [Methanomassiliicoccales archaeon]